ncbi:cytochrome c4 [Beggiatoa sp. PS]|nr:cytochrome c4 [Beggiatoa sp. PS]
MKKHLLLVMTTWATLSVATIPANAAGNIEAGKTKSQACMACHGVDGNSLIPMFPKIAGQSVSYIVKQLQDFKAKRRADLDNLGMAPMADSLNEQDRENLAAYFSSQTLKPASSNKADLAKKGKQIYRKGQIKESVIACVGCHGLKGAGNNKTLEFIGKATVVEAPAIGGQHAAYLVKQLKAFREEKRSNDVGKIMRNIAEGLTDEEMDAVAEYISTLN